MKKREKAKIISDLVVDFWTVFVRQIPSPVHFN